MELKRELGTIGVFAMATGAMISSGLFVLPTIVYGEAGPAFVLSYLIAAIALLPSLLCKAELMTAMPKAGGTYYHVDRSFGPAVGMIGGTANWAALAAKSAFALIGIGTFAAYISGEFAFLPDRRNGAGRRFPRGPGFSQACSDGDCWAWPPWPPI